MKKSQGLSLTTIIIAAIVLIVLVILWGIFTGRMGNLSGFVEETQLPQSKHNLVCQNLEKNNTVYWEIINTRNEIQYEYIMMIKDMDGTKIYAKSWDTEGVVCRLPAEGCFGGLWCMDVEMLIPVEYSEWNTWFYGDINECIDTDANSHTISGSVIDSSGTEFFDSCSTLKLNTVLERICENGAVSTLQIKCRNECSKGKCIN